ncbi:hypothetical protein PHSC3_000269 [Chlamydiales bacterium STE3]|nr:hypothetical protein PHSC3_000269 [Chlamydiales bacterium STE3]
MSYPLSDSSSSDSDSSPWVTPTSTPLSSPENSPRVVTASWGGRKAKIEAKDKLIDETFEKLGAVTKTGLIASAHFAVDTANPLLKETAKKKFPLFSSICNSSIDTSTEGFKKSATTSTSKSVDSSMTYSAEVVKKSTTYSIQTIGKPQQ